MDSDSAADQALLARARGWLEQERIAALERQVALAGDITSIVEAREGANGDDEHDPEGATIAFERARTDALAQQTARRIGEIDDALARIDDGTYGLCAVCGEPIPEDRLEARPTAPTHVDHALASRGSGWVTRRARGARTDL